MKKKNEFDFFIIKRLDQLEKSNSLSNIYNLSTLNKVKEVKPKKNNKIQNLFQNIIKSEDSEKISYDNKMIIIQALKKSILSSNLSFKWSLISFRNHLISVHFNMVISALISIAYCIYAKKYNLSENLNTNNSFVVSNTSFHVNNSINFSNELNNNSIFSNITNIFKEKDKINEIELIMGSLFNHILLIPIWIIFFLKYIPQRNEINQIIYKVTRYILICESFENKNFYYYLLKDYSILVTKKDFYFNNLSSPEIEDNLHPEKNIFLYCINYINDSLIKNNIKSNYYQLMTREDRVDINVLIKLIEVYSDEKYKKLFKKILIPIIFFFLITFYYSRASLQYIHFSISGIILILFLANFLCSEYSKISEKNLDLLIDIYNNVLLERKRFIYRRNKLIMYFVLKDKINDKNQIINAIEKIIDS